MATETNDAFGLDGAVIERTADRAGIATDALVDALDVLHAELLGRHSDLEGTGAYVTHDGVRAYRVRAHVWDDFLETFELDAEIEAAVRHAHTEQARQLFAATAEGGDSFDGDEEGVVVEIDTAKQW